MMDGGEGEREEESRGDADKDLCRGARAKPSPRLAGLYKWNVPHGFAMCF